jgi:nicotinate-nucleotide adenylyltransferase
MRIGLFGGTFDPIHIGHLNLAITLKEAHNLDEVWMIPVTVSPHKLAKPPKASSADRLTMTQLAVGDIPGFRVDDIEVSSGKPCYTYETIKKFVDANPNDSFFLMLGEDSLAAFNAWHEPRKIVALTTILIGSRPNPPQIPEGDPVVIEALKKGLTETALMEMSSSGIRARLGQEKFCGHLLPSKVIDYIIKHRLYLQA